LSGFSISVAWTLELHPDAIRPVNRCQRSTLAELPTSLQTITLFLVLAKARYFSREIRSIFVGKKKGNGS
jgi:hypothetical protein